MDLPARTLPRAATGPASLTHSSDEKRTFQSQMRGAHAVKTAGLTKQRRGISARHRASRRACRKANLSQQFT
jgi:hypothetical protein